MHLVDEIHSITATDQEVGLLSLETRGDDAASEMRQGLIDALWAHDPDHVGAEFDSLLARLEAIPGAPARVQGELDGIAIVIARTIGE